MSGLGALARAIDPKAWSDPELESFNRQQRQDRAWCEAERINELLAANGYVVVKAEPINDWKSMRDSMLTRLAPQPLDAARSDKP